jgi:YesN/AraC family two-component response regulator
MMMNTIESASEKEYIHRINAVLDYIDQHLDKELSLHELANVATFSKYHSFMTLPPHLPWKHSFPMI